MLNANNFVQNAGVTCGKSGQSDKIGRQNADTLQNSDNGVRQRHRETQ